MAIGNKVNLIGKTFGKLRVVRESGRNHRGEVMWSCKCNCGGSSTTKTYALTSGGSKSCGCLPAEIKKEKAIIAMVGKTFGRLTVLSYNSKSSRCYLWNCRCSCGAEVKANTNALRRKDNSGTKSCGCLQKESPSKYLIKDMVGRKFTRLTVVSRAKSTAVGDARWNCKCSCGATLIALGKNLRGGGYKSCGCWTSDRVSKMALSMPRRTFSRVRHWKTGKMLVCMSGWENKVVRWLNKKRIDFKWQVPIQITKRSKYIVDLYLKEDKKFVEIKGREFATGMKKWRWLKRNYPNSEIWRAKELFKLGVLRTKTR